MGNAGQLIRAARRRVGLSQRALAARSGVSQPMIAAIEGARQDPRHSTLDRLLRACGHELDLVPHAGDGVDRTQFAVALRRSPRERLAWAADGAAALATLRGARRIR